MRQYAAFLGCFSVVKYWARHFLQGFLRFFEPRRVGADSLSGMGTVKGQATPWNNVQCEFQHFNVRVLHRELAPLTAHRFSRSVPYSKKGALEIPIPGSIHRDILTPPEEGAFQA